ncbi:MAG: hypothetical protein IT359_05770 [Gemmatimonadaceae bacterium]|nr:hypothetical protein [Gemmatimonadaceae bacterium]
MNDAYAAAMRDSILAHPSMRALLAGAIDYAGLFPPASLELPAVVANYRDYRASADSWSLGRLVVPAARLAELARVASTAWGNSATPWRISALAGADPAANGAAGAAADAERIAAFNVACFPHACVDSVESRVASVEQVRALAGVFPSTEHYVELPLAAELAPLVRAVQSIGARAKVRTGGITPDAIPAPRDVARFLRACADAGLPFKATAGLHHPMRGEYRLTYAANAAKGTMFGYLNLFLAAAQARAGAPLEQLVLTLDGRNRAMLGIHDDEIRWEGGRASVKALAAMRHDFAIAFGSCSFREPLDDLGTLYAE